MLALAWYLQVLRLNASFLFSYLWQFWFAGPVFKIFNRAFVLEHRAKYVIMESNLI